MSKMFENWQFWASIIGGVTLTVSAFTDLKSDVRVQSERIEMLSKKMEQSEFQLQSIYKKIDSISLRIFPEDKITLLESDN